MRSRAFQGCNGLTELTFAEGMIVHVGAFQGCSGLTQLNFVEGMKIDSLAFSACTDLAQLTLVEGMEIGRSAFHGCTGLTQLNLAEGVKLAQNAFEGCRNLKAINVFSIKAEELNRIKAALPDFADKISLVDKSIINQVNAIKNQALYDLLHDNPAFRTLGKHGDMGESVSINISQYSNKPCF